MSFLSNIKAIGCVNDQSLFFRINGILILKINQDVLLTDHC